jgi:hypothetical protein
LKLIDFDQIKKDLNSKIEQGLNLVSRGLRAIFGRVVTVFSATEE